MIENLQSHIHISPYRIILGTKLTDLKGVI